MPDYEVTSVDFPQLRRLMARSTVLGHELRAIASRGAAYAESISPDAAPYGQGYKASFKVELQQFSDGVPFAVLFNDSPISVVVEYGSTAQLRPQGGSSPPQYVLARTVAFLRST